MKRYLLLLLLWCVGHATSYKYDVVVYGGNAAGIMAAIEVARMGKSVVLLEPSQHIGGMTSSGLGLIDATEDKIVGGLAHEFFHRVWLYYQDAEHWVWEDPHFLKSQMIKCAPDAQTMWVLEPHVAENIFHSMLQEVQVTLFVGEQLDRKHGVLKDGTTLVQITTKSGHIFEGDVFIDATYEGDLMAAVGVSYIVGREANSCYGEHYNGIRPNQNMPLKIDPYVIPGDPSSGFLPHLRINQQIIPGAGDHGVQAYNYRMCLTHEPENRKEIEQPEGYNESDYEILFRAITALKQHHAFIKLNPIPNKKVDSNHSGPLSTDYVGMSWEYPEADDITRQQIIRAHQKWQKGLLWTLQHHPRVPEKIREYYCHWGLAKDEFVDNDHWPYQLYIREARRMISDYVVTEATVLGQEQPKDSVGLASYPMDSHAIQFYVHPKGLLKTEGGLYQKIPKPFPISYRALVPKQEECTNLIVPVCLSASHSAYGSIRMEPIFMILGQSSGALASLAVDLQTAVQQVPYFMLCARLLSDDQVLYYTKN